MTKEWPHLYLNILDPSVAMYDDLIASSYMVNGCHSNGTLSLHDCDVSVSIHLNAVLFAQLDKSHTENFDACNVGMEGTRFMSKSTERENCLTLIYEAQQDTVFIYQDVLEETITNKVECPQVG